MKNISLEHTQALHQAGKLKEAKEGYLFLLKKNPKDAHLLHALSILCAQQQNFPEALENLEKAIHIDSSNLTFRLHLANLQKAQGLYTQAYDTLQTILKINPDFPPAYNNLGTVCYTLGKLEDAIIFYKKALEKQPEYIDAYYNLGLALNKLQQYDQAIHTYEKILALSPDHFAARFHLAANLMQQEKYALAEKEFLTIEAAQPYHLETQMNLATCFLKQGALKEAKQHYLKALELAKEETQILFNLGAIEMELGFSDQAIQYYQRALQANPDLFAAHNNLGVIFIAKQQPSLALHHFKEALRLEPNNEAIRYTVDALMKNQKLLASPHTYIKTLFDAYADHYDIHLTKALDYQIPSLFFNAVSKVISLKNKTLDILDLGCGTGLTAAPFQSIAKKIIGVDLSANMLAIAKNKNIYDELIESDVVNFLQTQSAVYDLILAGDVLVYQGALETLFSCTHRALRERGLWVFNAEITEEADFIMNQSGRFAHDKKYLDALIAAHHYETVFYEVTATRLQNHTPLLGHLYVLRKTHSVINSS